MEIQSQKEHDAYLLSIMAHNTMTSEYMACENICAVAKWVDA